MGKVRDFIVQFLTVINYEHGKIIKKYLAINMSSHTPRREWASHYVVQFNTKKEWYSWRSQYISKNQRRFWVLYQCIEKGDE